ncbi:MAG: hypothetical protein MN733_08000 [Nitrososphaera sp.]|nr:hypothetical protein [Nitrososphaera sp.]
MTGNNREKDCYPSKACLWIKAPFSKRKLVLSEKQGALIAFLAAIVVRAIPEALAYPYPLGYDVINYYIPVVENLPEQWSSIASEFPLYPLVLFSAKMITGLSAQSVVVGMGIGVFGIFGLSVFYLARSVLKLEIVYSIFLALFVIVQPAVLRTTWDLHRDVFALSTMFCVFSLLSRKQTPMIQAAPILVLSSLTAVADRMIGLLFCISIGAFALVNMSRLNSVASILSTVLLLTLLAVSGDFAAPGTLESSPSSPGPQAPYTPANLFVLFAIFNALLLAPAVIGFVRIENVMLKVPLLAALAGAFSWTVFSNYSELVADRWIILSGIFMSIFAGYGIVHLLRKREHWPVIGATILSAFVVLGLAYAVMPYDEPFVLYGLARQSTEDFGPVTMQFNALDIKDNDELVMAIERINRDTENDAVVVGEKHWRGFMEIYLQDDRTYRFSQDPEVLAAALADTRKDVYLITLDQETRDLFTLTRVEDKDRR